MEIEHDSGVDIGRLPAGLPAGRLSVKGRGRFSPSPDGFETLPDGNTLLSVFMTRFLCTLRWPTAKHSRQLRLIVCSLAGLIVPCGLGQEESRQGRSFLHHNEYIVYNPAQVQHENAKTPLNLQHV